MLTQPKTYRIEVKGSYTYVRFFSEITKTEVSVWFMTRKTPWNKSKGVMDMVNDLEKDGWKRVV